MSYREFSTPSGGVRRQNKPGKRFHVEHLDAGQLLAALEESDPESWTWRSRAENARDRAAIPSDIFNQFVDRLNPVADTLTWKELFYVWRIAHLTWRITGGCSAVELAANCGLA